MELSNEKIDIIVAVLVALTFLVVIFNFYTSLTLSEQIDKKIEELSNVNVPKINIYLIKESSCNECLDLQGVASSLASSFPGEANLEVLNREEGNSFIRKYLINRLPAIVIEGDISSFNVPPQLNFVEKNGALVFEGAVPYFSLEDNSVKGVVEFILINHKGCEVCKDMKVVYDSLTSTGIVGNLKELEHPSEEANEFANNYSITKYPTMLISKDIDEYGIPIGDSNLVRTYDNYYVLDPIPPYFDLEEKRIRGELEVIYLFSQDCEDCINISTFSSALRDIGLYLKNETEVEINSPQGEELISIYNITKVPTFILKGDIEAYPGLRGSLEEIGYFVNESFVFSDLERVGKYIAVGEELENESVNTGNETLDEGLVNETMNETV